MDTSLNCLICSRVVISDDGEETSRKRSQFRQGLQLFCKLLQINGNYVNRVFLIWEGGHEEDVVGTGLPCCKECWLGFEQMLRLQQAIELMQVNLMEQLDKLKAALKTSVPSDYEEDPLKIPPDDILGKLRDQLLSCVRNSSTPSSLTSDQPSRKRRKQSLTKSREDPNSLLTRKGKEYQPCSVVLERLPVNILKSILSPEKENPVDITIKQEINGHFNEPHGYGGGYRSPRKSKLKAFEVIRENSIPQNPSPSVAIVKDDRCDSNDEEYVPSPEAPSPTRSNDDEDEDEYPWESEAKPISQPLPNPINKSCGTNSKFSLISPDTLLYQYTLIKVSHGYTQFTCQEPECPSPHFSDLSLNWNNLFNLIADHIKLVHSIAPEELARKCPLCPVVFPSGPQFRAHLIGTGKNQKGHRIETVICELCWKPIRNLADAFRCHLWYHKNEQEKIESPDGLPPTLMSKYTRQRNQKMFRKYGKPMKVKKVKPNKVKPKPQKKRKIKQSDLKDEEDCAPDSEPLSPFPNNNNDDNEYEDSWKPEVKPILETVQNQSNSSCGTGRLSTKFSLISPDTLLYQYTLIKVSEGYTHFTCQEPECPSPNFSDPSLLNWNSLFNQIADHIKLVHSGPPSNDEPGRKCPLCPAILPAGPKFRSHLFATKRKRKGFTHRIETIVCDICWRPIRNWADTYRCHQWMHKSEQEKKESPEELPPSFKSKAKKLKKKSSKIKSENPQVRPKLSLKMDKSKHGVDRKSKANCTDQPDIQLEKPSSAKKSKGRAPQVGDHFCRILEENSRESLLLYKSTLLKASHGVSLTCQESNCDHIVNGSDLTAFEEFKDHVKNCHETGKADSIRKCPLCSEQLQSGKRFRTHLLYKCDTVSQVAMNGFPFICTVCWRPMVSVPSLEYHQWLHKNEIEKEMVLNNAKEQPPPVLLVTKEKERQSQLKCRHCQREFQAVTNLRAHETTHLPKEQRKKYMCNQCPKLFLSPVAVRAHVEREHQRELMRMRTCPICSQQFNWRNGYSFRSHLRSHKNERPFVCEICGKAFLSSMDLKNHKRNVHEHRDRRWQCEFCEMSYKESYHLKRHKKSAHKDKVVELEDKVKGVEEKVVFGPKIAFPCPVCEKVFELKSRMKKHWDKSCKHFIITKT